jgi:RND superfamily putative drug exporter
MLKVAVQEKLSDELKADSKLHFLGPTASIRDLKTITSGDQVRIDVLVPGVVFLILMVLLRKGATSAYLIFTVFFSYLVTLGVAFVVFGAVHWFSTHDLGGFAGLDWKVRMFLFTILIAVGQDYNIFLITRIEEEQRIHGPVRGVIEALLKTGSIISSCGIIMAGTFSSLMFGSLAGMQQLGFAWLSACCSTHSSCGPCWFRVT